METEKQQLLSHYFCTENENCKKYENWFGGGAVICLQIFHFLLEMNVPAN